MIYTWITNLVGDFRFQLKIVLTDTSPIILRAWGMRLGMYRPVDMTETFSPGLKLGRVNPHISVRSFRLPGQAQKSGVCNTLQYTVINN